MHAETHPDIVGLPVEILVPLVDSPAFEGFLNDGLLHGHAEVVERVLRLEALAETRLQELLAGFRLDLFMFLVLFLGRLRDVQLDDLPRATALGFLGFNFLFVGGEGGFGGWCRLEGEG